MSIGKWEGKSVLAPVALVNRLAALQNLQAQTALPALQNLQAQTALPALQNLALQIPALHLPIHLIPHQAVLSRSLPAPAAQIRVAALRVHHLQRVLPAPHLHQAAPNLPVLRQSQVAQTALAVLQSPRCPLMKRAVLLTVMILV